MASVTPDECESDAEKIYPVLPILAGIVRHLIALGGGLLAQKGILDSESVEPFVGSSMVIVGIGWSVFHKIKTDKRKEKTK